MWKSINVLFCFFGAQGQLTSRQADRKGVHSRWIGPVIGTTLIAGTRVSNCRYKNHSGCQLEPAGVSTGLVFNNTRNKRTGSQCWVWITIYLVCASIMLDIISRRGMTDTQDVSAVCLSTFVGNLQRITHFTVCQYWRKYIAVISDSVLPTTFAASFKPQRKLFCMHLEVTYSLRYRQVMCWHADKEVGECGRQRNYKQNPVVIMPVMAK